MLTSGGSVHEGVVINVSAGGAFVSISIDSLNASATTTISHLEKGGTVKITIPAVGVSSASAEVVRESDDDLRRQSLTGSWGRGVGVRFDPIQPKIPVRLLDSVIRKRPLIS